MADLARIEQRLDLVAAGGTEISDDLGGLRFQNMTEVMEFSKLMSLSGNAVPKHLQANPGMCLAVCVQALEWRFSPFAVANKSYEVQGRLSFESQLVHAVIEQRAPIIGRLMHKFEGDGDDRRCIVWATLKETGEKLEYISPPFGKIQPKNSPLWKTKPDLQQYYNTSRDFCRIYFPDVLLGVYADDELRDHVGPDNAKDVSRPNIKDRLKGNKDRGFSQNHVERETRTVIDETNSDASRTDAAPPAPGDVTPPATSIPPEQVAGTNTSAATDAAGQPDRTETVAEPNDGGSHEVASNASRETEGGAAKTEDAALPAGWAKDYAAALRRAVKKDSLPKYAKQFWATLNTEWAVVQETPDGTIAANIYRAFTDNFENKKALDEALREIVA